MSTSIHIPKPLLEAVDRRAQALRISRNRLIVRALEREIAEGEEWPAEFFDRLRAVDPGMEAVVDDMLAAVRVRRRSKRPRRL